MYKRCAIAVIAAIGCVSAPGIHAADWSWDPITNRMHTPGRKN